MPKSLFRTFSLFCFLSLGLDTVSLDGMCWRRRVAPSDSASSVRYLGDDGELGSTQSVALAPSCGRRMAKGCISFCKTTAGKVVIGVAGYLILNFLTGLLVAQVGSGNTAGCEERSAALMGILQTCQNSLAASVNQCPASQGLLANVTQVLLEMSALLKQNATAATAYSSQLLEQMITALVSDRAALQALLNSHKETLTAVATNVTTALSQFGNAITENTTMTASQVKDVVATTASMVTQNVTNALSQVSNAIMANGTMTASQVKDVIVATAGVVTQNVTDVVSIVSNTIMENGTMAVSQVKDVVVATASIITQNVTAVMSQVSSTIMANGTAVAAQFADVITKNVTSAFTQLAHLFNNTGGSACDCKAIYDALRALNTTMIAGFNNTLSFLNTFKDKMTDEHTLILSYMDSCVPGCPNPPIP